jgi:hypothetical protein
VLAHLLTVLKQRRREGAPLVAARLALGAEQLDLGLQRRVRMPALVVDGLG